MDINELKKDIKINANLTNRLTKRAAKIGITASTDEIITKLTEIKEYYLELLDMIKKDKYIIPERKNSYKVIYELIAQALIILLPRLETIVDIKSCEKSNISTTLEENKDYEEYNDLIDNIKNLIYLTKQTCDIEYIKVINDAIKKINKATTKLNIMNMKVKFKWNMTIPINEYLKCYIR